MRHNKGLPVHRGKPGRFDGVLLISGLAISKGRQGRTWTHIKRSVWKTAWCACC
jgi:hypothetical protein